MTIYGLRARPPYQLRALFPLSPGKSLRGTFSQVALQHATCEYPIFFYIIGGNIHFRMLRCMLRIRELEAGGVQLNSKSNRVCSKLQCNMQLLNPIPIWDLLVLIQMDPELRDCEVENSL